MSSSHRNCIYLWHAWCESVFKNERFFRYSRYAKLCLICTFVGRRLVAVQSNFSTLKMLLREKYLLLPFTFSHHTLFYFRRGVLLNFCNHILLPMYFLRVMSLLIVPLTTHFHWVKPICFPMYLTIFILHIERKQNFTSCLSSPHCSVPMAQQRELLQMCAMESTQ